MKFNLLSLLVVVSFHSFLLIKAINTQTNIKKHFKLLQKNKNQKWINYIFSAFSFQQQLLTIKKINFHFNNTTALINIRTKRWLTRWSSSFNMSMVVLALLINSNSLLYALHCTSDNAIHLWHKSCYYYYLIVRNIF